MSSIDDTIIDTPEGRHYVTHGITGVMGMPVAVAVRPEKIALQTEAPTLEQRANAGEHGYNCVQGAITAMAYFGNETLYHVRLTAAWRSRFRAPTPPATTTPRSSATSASTPGGTAPTSSC